MDVVLIIIIGFIAFGFYWAKKSAPRIVENLNGEFGIEKGLFDKRMLDLYDYGYWWSGENKVKFKCWITDKEKVIEIFNKL